MTATMALRGVGKRYVQFIDTPILAQRGLRVWHHSRRGSIWALRDVDLDVGPGEALGIIGRNGSGKSTLLQLLAGVTAPTKGSVRVTGRLAPLLAVGVGFHPELTGRENIYVNGTILGVARGELDGRLDAIIAFAELEKFIDTPVKFYSSGMYVRLGFAVAIESHPDILLVDEVLAVGDQPFRQKCFQRMKEIRDSGSTVVLVTHNLNLLRHLCPRTVLINEGRVVYDGETARAVEDYHSLVGEDREPDRLDDIGRELDERLRVDRLELLDRDGKASFHVTSGEWRTFALSLEALRPTERPTLSLRVETTSGFVVSEQRECWRADRDLAPGEHLDLEAELRMDLAHGSYRIFADLDDRSGHYVATTPQPALFYVSGQPGVSGLADLQGAVQIRTAVGGVLP